MTSLRDRASQALRFGELEGRFDVWLLASTIALACIGVVMVASSSMPFAMSGGHDAFYYLERHVVYLIAGFVLCLVMMRIEIKLIEKYSQTFVLLCFLLLVIVFVPGMGRTINGARRWLNLGIASFQVVETVKLLFIIWLASYMVRHRDTIGDGLKALFWPIIAAGALVGLLLLQPDFGSAMLLLVVTGGMICIGGARIRAMVLPSLAGLAAMSFIVMLEPYRVRRLTSFSNPFDDAFGSGYQLVQALIAIGRGEFSGVGLGGSVLKLDYLPEAHSDFIFSVIAEEFGFIGVCAMVALYVVITWRAFRIGRRCIEMRRHFGGYCAIGIGMWISLQSFVSMGVNLGVLPTKGLTLPLVSSGGSSVLMTCVAFGLLFRIGYELDRAERQVARVRGDAARLESELDAMASIPPVLPTPVRLHVPVWSKHYPAQTRVEPRLGVQR